jgi:hypothetical protein
MLVVIEAGFIVGLLLGLSNCIIGSILRSLSFVINFQLDLGGQGCFDCVVAVIAIRYCWGSILTALWELGHCPLRSGPIHPGVSIARRPLAYLPVTVLPPYLAAL